MGADDYRIAVAVGNPDHAEQLVRTARDLARENDGEVFVVGVVVTPRSSPFALFKDEVITREFGGERRALLDRAVDVASGRDVPVSGQLFVASSVWRGVVHAVDQRDCDALVVGWQDRSRESAVLGTNVDRIVSRTDCDVLVEKIGAIADGVEAVLLPVAEGPNTALAGEVAGAIARSNDARLNLLRVVDSGTEEDEDRGRELLAEFAERFPDLPVETTVRTGNVVDGIVTASRDRDVTVLGATRSGRIRQRIVGSTPRKVGERAEGTVILARRNQGSGVTQWFRV